MAKTPTWLAVTVIASLLLSACGAQEQIEIRTLGTAEFAVIAGVATFGGDATLVMAAESAAIGVTLPEALLVAGATWVVVEGAQYNYDCATGPHTYMWVSDGAQALRVCVQLPDPTPDQRHSQDDHDPRTAQTARDRLKTVEEKYGTAECREAEYQAGVRYLRVFVETGIDTLGNATGIVSWFRVGNQGRQNWGWAGAFEMTRTQFVSGRPRGIVSIGEPQPCGNFTGAAYIPPTASQIAP